MYYILNTLLLWLDVIIMPPPVGRGQVSIAFVCPSVRRVHTE